MVLVNIFVVTLVHPVLATSPESLHIVTLTCVSHCSVGWLSAAKYSVMIQLPRGQSRISLQLAIFLTWSIQLPGLYRLAAQMNQKAVLHELVP